MKFRIFGDLDCPDWLLAEVFAMSKLSVVKLRLVCSALVKHLSSTSSTSVDNNLDNNNTDAALLATVAKHTSDAKFSDSDNQALISALTQLFTSANKYSASPDTLGEELQQLGLPKEHAGQIVRVYTDANAALTEYANARELRLSRLASCDWTLRLLMSPHSGLNSLPQVRFKLGIVGCYHGDSEGVESVEFEASEQRLRLLKHETARLLALMEHTMRTG